MSIFGLEPFDERLEAIQNKAGRVAFEVMYIALLLSLVVYTQVTGKKNEALEYFVLGIAMLGMAVFQFVSYRSGISMSSIKENIYRIGKSSNNAKRYLRRQIVFIGCLLVVIVLANHPVTEMGWFGAVFWCVAIGITVWITYASTKASMTVKPESLIKAKRSDDE